MGRPKLSQRMNDRLASGDPLGEVFYFTAFFVCGIVLLLPGMLLSVCAGALYGMHVGFLVAWLSTAVGQTLAFVIGRYRRLHFAALLSCCGASKQ